MLLWIASVVVGVIGSIVAFASLGSIIDAVTSGAGGPEAAFVAQAVTVGIVVGAVFGLVFVAAQVVFAIFLRRGRNWARIVLAILGGLGVVVTIVSLFLGSTTEVNGRVIETGGVLTTVVSLLQAVLIVGAIVMSFRPAANQYISAVSAGAR